MDVRREVVGVEVTVAAAASQSQSARSSFSGTCAHDSVVDFVLFGSSRLLWLRTYGKN
jgi:hypothetical protein